MGKKYIIELEENEHLYKTKMVLGEPMMCSVFPEPYTEPDLEQVRKEAYDKGMGDAEMLAYKLYSPKIDEAYQRGLSDAWEAARKIILPSKRGGVTVDEFALTFGCDISKYDVIEKYSASEAIEKIRQYEQGKEEQIQVGDEVITASGKAVVTGVGPVHFEYVYADGSHGYDEVKNVKKTGRHFPEIAAVLEKMQMKDGDNE